MLKLTDPTLCLYGLINFEYEAHSITGNEKDFESDEICLEKLVKSHKVSLFWADFSYLESLCGVKPK